MQRSKTVGSQSRNKRRRVKSSETEIDMTSSHSSDSEAEAEAEASKMEMERATEVLADFMDRFDCNFDAIIQRLCESHQWQVLDESMCRMEKDMAQLKEENTVLKNQAPEC